MEKFLNNLKSQAEENPVMALAVAAGLLTAVGKFIDATGAAVGRRAYAKQVDYKIKKTK